MLTNLTTTDLIITLSDIEDDYFAWASDAKLELLAAVAATLGLDNEQLIIDSFWNDTGVDLELWADLNAELDRRSADEAPALVYQSEPIMVQLELPL